MSKLSDRIENTIRNDVNSDDIVALWNTFAEKNSYERIYFMSDFDEIIGSDRSYHEVKEMLDDDFDESHDYFYFHSGTGYATSTNDPFDIVDVKQLADDIVENRGQGYDGVCEISDYFDGYHFSNEMVSIIQDLSHEELMDMVKAFEERDLDFKFSDFTVNTEADLQNIVYDELEKFANDYEYNIVYLMPEAVQKQFWELVEPDFDYVKDNIKEKGPLTAETALEIAGFERKEGTHYVFDHSSGIQHFDIKIKNGVIRDAKPYDFTKKEAKSFS